MAEDGKTKDLFTNMNYEKRKHNAPVDPKYLDVWETLNLYTSTINSCSRKSRIRY